MAGKADAVEHPVSLGGPAMDGRTRTHLEGQNQGSGSIDDDDIEALLMGKIVPKSIPVTLRKHSELVCKGINCDQYNGRCIAYKDIPGDCPLLASGSGEDKD